MGAIETAAAVDSRGHEPLGLEGPQMLRDRTESDVAERTVDLSGGALVTPHQPQDLAATRRRDALDGGEHVVTLV